MKDTNSKLYLPEFIPYYVTIESRFNLTKIETLLYGYIRFANGFGKFKFSQAQLSGILLMPEDSESIKKYIKSLVSCGIIYAKKDKNIKNTFYLSCKNLAEITNLDFKLKPKKNKTGLPQEEFEAQISYKPKYIQNLLSEWWGGRKKSANTLTALKKNLEFLDKQSEQKQVAILNQSIRSNWSGLFDVRDNNIPKVTQDSSAINTSMYQRL